MFASEIVHQNERLLKKKNSTRTPINLKSVLIGNGLTDVVSDSKLCPPFSGTQLTYSANSQMSMVSLPIARRSHFSVPDLPLSSHRQPPTINKPAVETTDLVDLCWG